jgi:hypothetical protein
MRQLTIYRHLKLSAKMITRVCATRHPARTLLIFAILSNSLVGAQPKDPTADPLLSAAAASSGWSSHYASLTNVRYRATISEQSNESSVGTDAVIRKYRDGDRLHVIVDYNDYLTATGAIVARQSQRAIVSDSSRRVSWWSPRDQPLTGTVQVARSPKRLQEMKLIDDSDPATGSFLDGNIDGLGNIIDLMTADIASAASSTRVHDEEWNGIPCKVVQVQAQTRRTAVWIAPAKSDVVVKYSLDSSDAATGPVKAQFEATDYLNVDGRTIVGAGHSSRSWIVASDHSSWQESVDARRVKLNLHPNLSEQGLFTTSGVPDGIRVFFDELPDVGVDFIWSKGSPVANIDADLFSQLETSVQRTSAGEVAKSSPLLSPSAAAAEPDPSASHVTQLWLVLGGTAVISTLILAGIFISGRSLRA